MEMFPNPINKVYEVEKIINCKFYKNKKYYLIKWLCYPITESTWEPKANIKHLSSMLKKFDANFPNSIDRDMYNIYCTANKKSRKKRSKKVPKNKEIKICTKSLSKTRKIEGFSKSELKENLFDYHVYFESDKYLFCDKTNLNKINEELFKITITDTDGKKYYFNPTISTCQSFKIVGKFFKYDNEFYTNMDLIQKIKQKSNK